jgi:hypothetical protein
MASISIEITISERFMVLKFTTQSIRCPAGTSTVANRRLYSLTPAGDFECMGFFANFDYISSFRVTEARKLPTP